MCRGTGVGGGEPSEPGDVAGQFDDALVVNVVQHRSISRALDVITLPIALGDRVSQPYIWLEMAEIQSGHFIRARRNPNHSPHLVLELWDSGVRRRPARQNLPMGSAPKCGPLSWTLLNFWPQPYARTNRARRVPKRRRRCRPCSV